MSGNVDSAGGPATPASMTGAPGSSVASGDGQYVKAIRKRDFKLTKLNSDNYQSWADGMEIMFNAKMMWSLIDGTASMPEALRPRDHVKWLTDNAQAKAWIYMNLENNQHNHIKGLLTAKSMWDALKKVHGALGQGRLNFLKRRFFNYKAGPTESIDEVASNLARLQMTIRDIKATESPINLDVALTVINSVEGNAYNMVKFHLEDMEDLTLNHIKERFKLVEQKIKDEFISQEIANRAESPSKGKKTRECFHCKRKGHLKTRCFKWLATDEGKKYAEEQKLKKKDKTDRDDETKPTNQKSRKSGRKEPDRPTAGARKVQEIESDSDSAFMAIEGFINRGPPKE